MSTSDLEHTISKNEKETKDNTEKREDTSWNRNGFWIRLRGWGTYVIDPVQGNNQSCEACVEENWQPDAVNDRTVKEAEDVTGIENGLHQYA